MKAEIKNIQGNRIDEITLSDNIFGVSPNNELLAQYIRVFRANQRQGTSSTKTKAEVSGGGRKPWKQKGTGKARQGSIRSPQWVHGGVAHGPKPKDWGLAFPKKMNRAAIISALSQKFVGEKAIILDQFTVASSKTKDVVEILKNLNVAGKTLLVLSKGDVNVKKASNNVPGLIYALVGTLNAHQLLGAKQVIFVKDSVQILEEKYKHETK